MRKTNQLISSNDAPFHIRNKDSHYEYSYLQMSVANLQSTSTLPQPLTFTSAQNSPFLAAPASEYELAISRFSLDTSSLPVFVPIIQLKLPNGTFNTNPNQTIYSITMTYASGGTTYAFESFLQWQPQNLSIQVPIAPYLNNPQVQDNSLAYYNAYNVQWVVSLLQTTFNSALAGLNAALTTAGVPIPTTNAPVITYNTDTACCTIYVDSSVYDPSPPTSVANPVKIYFNSPMYGLLDSFIFTYLGVTTVANSGQNYQLVIDSFNGTNQTPLPTLNPSPYDATFTAQTTSTIGLWSPVQSIIFTSNTLPINQTHILPSVVLLEGQNIGPNSSISNVQNIISSFQSPNNLYRPSITYEPSVYRFISLNGNNQLKLFNIQCYWQGWDGSINNFLLASQQNFSMLIMFKKIDTY
jgi:hypothetical protein